MKGTLQATRKNKQTKNKLKDIVERHGKITQIKIEKIYK